MAAELMEISAWTRGGAPRPDVLRCGSRSRLTRQLGLVRNPGTRVLHLGLPSPNYS
ncbi:hypothetical protein GGTG_05084 [Gaeumannomyces tritici R3-111a-1]|uniref:Uncharacterized protein n=1 Tax=Gaeumannomyces tritici (strain R3-111a-1) TaxID=644352 RepID=J3NUX5_GAET3|nr:hypothetical protein GGTG_05084 [Gaeumannomyces tritici R3-111a-1]EJT75147.1 hypothetical protein GGTG_05084 [Gaeumannomyces tritici R3-111a-1]